MNKKHRRALFRLGMMHAENDQSLPVAIEHLTRAHKLIPHKSDILYERGELYYRMGKLDASLNDKGRTMRMKQAGNAARPETTCYEVRERRSHCTAVDIVLFSFFSSESVCCSRRRKSMNPFRRTRS